jgi:hypothetical protein
VAAAAARPVVVRHLPGHLERHGREPPATMMCEQCGAGGEVLWCYAFRAWLCAPCRDQRTETELGKDAWSLLCACA